jgi:hypothetical protein
MDDQEKETRLFRSEVRQGLKCLHDSFQAYKTEDEEWKARFQPYLESELESQKEWRTLLRDKKKQLISRAIDGTFLAVVALLVYNAGAKLKAWLGALT